MNRTRQSKNPFQSDKSKSAKPSEWSRIFNSFVFTVFILTMSSFVMDVLLYARNGAFFNSFGYSIMLLIYAFGWSLALWCGRGVVGFFLILNFIMFCVFKEYYKLNIDPLNFYAIQSAYQEGIRAGLSHFKSLLDIPFWIMAGVTGVELIWTARHSFMNGIRFFWTSVITGLIVVVLYLCGVFQWLVLSLFLFPNLYTSYEQGLLYKITFPIESFTQNPLQELNQIILSGNQQHVLSYQTDNLALSRLPKHIYLIQVESLTTIALTDRVMPFLMNRLKQPNARLWVDEQHYHCLGSANTDFMMMTGLDLNCRTNHIIIYFKYPTAIYESIQTIPARLQTAGYQTFFLHGFEALFFNRVKHYPSMGFESVTFMENFAPRLKRGEWGVSDKDVLLTAAAQTQTETPTFTFIITAGMHPPYKPVSEKTSKPYPNPQTETEDYFNAVFEFDTGLRLFYEHLPADSLILVYGDHNAPDVGGFDTPFILLYKGNQPPVWPIEKQGGFQQTIHYINSILTPGQIITATEKEMK